MDSMGYNGDLLTKAPGAVSWAELLNNKWKGRVALLNDPGILTQDAGNAAQALGLMKFKNLGNMTRGEMDRLFKILTTYKKRGHFRAFWSTFNESVNLLASKEVVIESMWSPAVALLVAQGVNCRYAFPKEGMRGWCSAQGITARPPTTTPNGGRPSYDYLNWMYDGYLGALIMRQGYYIANGRQLRSWINCPKNTFGFTAKEVDFWYDGKVASSDLPGITGQVGDIKKGQRPRRRVAPGTRHPLLVLELVLHEQRVPGQEGERLPQRVDGWQRKPSKRARGRRAPPPRLP